MIKKIINKFKQLNKINELQVSINNINNENRKLLNELESTKILIGNLLSKNLISQNLTFNESEFKVFSQWGDDGIIQYLISKVEIENKEFVEFGVEDYSESNTRFLLLNNNWSGLVLDGSELNVNKIINSNYYWRFDLKALHHFINKENINQLIKDNCKNNNIGILSIDIDGNDYWIWDCIDVVNPDIVIVEYNSLFGSDKFWTTLYDPLFVRTNAHYSNLYYGVSLSSLHQLGIEKGYSLVGCNSNGNNAYFVRNDKVGNLQVLTPSEAYKEAKFRETRTIDGQLIFQTLTERQKELEGLPIYNTLTKKEETISF